MLSVSLCRHLNFRNIQQIFTKPGITTKPVKDIFTYQVLLRKTWLTCGFLRDNRIIIIIIIIIIGGGCGCGGGSSSNTTTTTINNNNNNNNKFLLPKHTFPVTASATTTSFPVIPTHPHNLEDPYVYIIYILIILC